jgi:HEAT repeat protein
MRRLSLLALLLLPLQPILSQTAVSASVQHARAVLRDGVTDKDPAVRIEVAVALSLIAAKDPTASMLEELARDKDHLVRVAALGSIGELRDLRLAKAAREALNDDVPEVAFAAARALFKLKQPEGRQALIEVVEKESKAKSGFLRAKFRDSWRRMKTPKSALFFAVQQGAGFVPVPGFGEGVSAMSSMLSDPEFSARATSLIMLSTDRTAEVRQIIEQSFMDEEWSMRAAAVQITAMRNERTWRGHIVPLLDDTHRKVRYRAAACYLRLN